MILRPILENEKEIFNAVVDHPLQSWQWGEFKQKEGVTVERIGFFDGNRLKKGLQVFFHKIPHTSYTMGYFPKGPMPDEDQLAALKQLAKQNNAVAIKLEPNVCHPVDADSGHEEIKKLLLSHGCREGKPLFTRYTFVLSLEPSLDALANQLKSKTRYNIHLAEKKGVTIVENSTDEGLKTHLEILAETTKRQGFFAHSPKYFQDMWELFKGSGMMRIFEARYQDMVLTSWIMFVHHNMLYYPYGASRSQHREVMASNLMMWEMIVFGKTLKLDSFDMWGALGPDPDPSDPWFGFHRFKQGYGGTLCEFLGTYDLVTNPTMYSMYTFADTLRWKYLRAKTRLRRLLPGG